MAKPPDSMARLLDLPICASLWPSPSRDARTEELLAAAAFLHNLNQARLQLLDRGLVVGEDTHLPRFGRNVDLDDILGLVDRLSVRQLASHPTYRPPPLHLRLGLCTRGSILRMSYLVRERQAQLELLDTLAR